MLGYDSFRDCASYNPILQLTLFAPLLKFLVLARFYDETRRRGSKFSQLCAYIFFLVEYHLRLSADIKEIEQ
jgi:hypothetical protein